MLNLLNLRRVANALAMISTAKQRESWKKFYLSKRPFSLKEAEEMEIQAIRADKGAQLFSRLSHEAS